MENSQLIGRIKGAPTLFTRYRPAGNNIYNSTTKLSSLYDTTITTPLNNQVFYLLTTLWRNKTLQATGGNVANIYWGDMYGQSLTSGNVASTTFTYSNASSKYIQYQRLSSAYKVQSFQFDNDKLNTGNIYSLLNTVDTENYALISATNERTNSFVSSTVMASYLISDTRGILLRNECYDRNFEINSFIRIPSTSFSVGASFKLYIYLGTDIIAQTQVYCNSTTDPIYINLYGVIRTSVLDINKYIDLKIQYLGTGLLTDIGFCNLVVKVL
jgi:hypothetical protein